MSLQKSKKKLLDQLIDASYQLSKVIFASEAPEGFSRSYLNDKESFNKMIASGIKMERLMRSYFKDQESRIIEKIDWRYYQQNMKFAAEGDSLIETINWLEEELQLKINFNVGMAGAFYGGMAAAAAEVGVASVAAAEVRVASVILPGDAPAIKALHKYGLNRSKLITDGTKERIIASLKSSLQDGLDKDQAAERLIKEKIINDPARAKMIAHTEQVQAFTEGRKAVGDEVGARFKVWDNGQPGACKYCEPLHETKIPWDEYFVSGKLSSWAAPLHPNCYCGWHMVL